MSDTTMCEDKECPLKLNCYRYTAQKGERQSYFMWTPRKGNECEYYWESEITKKDGNE